jgi:hypothetical protein
MTQAIWKKVTETNAYSESVAVGSPGYTDALTDAGEIRKTRLQIDTIGANWEIEVEESVDGTNWVSLEAHTTTGLKTAVTPYAGNVRVIVNNTGGGAEACAWSLLIERDHYQIVGDLEVATQETSRIHTIGHKG